MKLLPSNQFLHGNFINNNTYLFRIHDYKYLQTKARDSPRNFQNGKVGCSQA